MYLYSGDVSLAYVYEPEYHEPAYILFYVVSLDSIFIST